MPSATAFYIGAAVLSTAATVYGTVQQGKAADAQADNAKRVENLQQRRADVATSRERAKQVRASRIARATAKAQSVGAGEATGGSGLAGVQANIGSNAARNASFLGKNQEISTSISNLNVDSAKSAAKFGKRANTAGAAASVFDVAADLTQS